MYAFVQVNEDSPKGENHPVGYIVGEDSCWEWVGAMANGYGRIWDVEHKKLLLAHRRMYEAEHGPIPEGKECHHVCGNKGCVNPDHLEIVTRQEHYDRDEGYRIGTQKGAAFNLTKTRCPRGHHYTGSNLVIAPRTGYRECLECRRISGRKQKQRMRRGS